MTTAETAPSEDRHVESCTVDHEPYVGGIQHRRVEIIRESRWSDEGRSFYFRDPTGNLLEIANTDFWPR